MEAECAERGAKAPPFGGVNRRNRSRWIDGRRSRRGVSFRQVNRKYTLSAEQVEVRLGKLWRDAVRRRANFGEGLLMCNWGETPVVR